MNRAIAFFAGALSLALLGSGCALVLFPDDEWVVPTPRWPNEIVAAGSAPAVTFRAAVEQTSAEALFSIEDAGGAVSGRPEWSGNTLSFVAQPQLDPGVRYVLSFSGEFRDASGTPRTASVEVPFFYVSDALPLDITEALPVTGSRLDPDEVVTFVFSKRVSPDSLLGRVSVSPTRDYETEWDADYLRLVLRPKEGWSDKTAYSILFEEGITAADGTVLRREAEYRYLVQSDTAPPRLVSIEAAVDDRSNGYPALGTDLGALLGPEDVIKLTFSEPMDRESVESALRLTPDATDSPQWIDSSTVVYPARERWESGVEYILFFDGELSDVAGNVAEDVTPIRFVPASAASLGVVVNFTRDDPPGSVGPGGFTTNVPVDINVGPPTADQYTFAIDFSGGTFSTVQEREAVLDQINVSAVFPDTIGSPLLTGFSWSSDTALTVTFFGFESSPVGQENLYMLEIGVSDGSIAAGNGALLAEPVRQLLRGEP